MESHDENTHDTDSCCSEKTTHSENDCVNRHIENNYEECTAVAHLTPVSKSDGAVEEDVDAHSDDADAILKFESDQSEPSMLKPCVQSKILEYSTRCFSCAISVIQFFDFFGDALTAANVESISIPEISRLCVELSDSCHSEKDMPLLDSVGNSLCAVLQIQLEGHRHWSATIITKFGNELLIQSNDEFDRHSILNEIQTLIRTARITNGSESNSWFRSIPEFRIDLIALLLHAATECDFLRSIYDTWTEKLEILQAKGNDIQRLLVEIEEQDAEFAIQVATVLPDRDDLSLFELMIRFFQVTEPWKESGGFRLFQILGTMHVSEDGKITGDVKEWSPGDDVLEGKYVVLGEQRFSIQGKTVRRIHVDQACWFPVTVREGQTWASWRWFEPAL